MFYLLLVDVDIGHMVEAESIMIMTRCRVGSRQILESEFPEFGCLHCMPLTA